MAIPTYKREKINTQTEVEKLGGVADKAAAQGYAGVAGAQKNLSGQYGQRSRQEVGNLAQRLGQFSQTLSNTMNASAQQMGQRDAIKDSAKRREEIIAVRKKYANDPYKMREEIDKITTATMQDDFSVYGRVYGNTADAQYAYSAEVDAANATEAARMISNDDPLKFQNAFKKYWDETVSDAPNEVGEIAANKAFEKRGVPTYARLWRAKNDKSSSEYKARLTSSLKAMDSVASQVAASDDPVGRGQYLGAYAANIKAQVAAGLLDPNVAGYKMMDLDKTFKVEGLNSKANSAVMNGEGVEFVQNLQGLQPSKTYDLNKYPRLKGVDINVTNGILPVLKKYGINLVDEEGAGFRKEVGGGAKQSKHLEGKAVDLNVTGMSINKRTQLLKDLRAQGFRGFGIGKNTIHADMREQPASWSYIGGTQTGGGKMPSWASEALVSPASAFTPLGQKEVTDFNSLPMKEQKQVLDNAMAQVKKKNDSEVLNNDHKSAMFVSNSKANLAEIMTTTRQEISIDGTTPDKVTYPKEKINTYNLTAADEKTLNEFYEGYDSGVSDARTKSYWSIDSNLLTATPEDISESDLNEEDVAKALNRQRQLVKEGFNWTSDYKGREGINTIKRLFGMQQASIMSKFEDDDPIKMAYDDMMSKFMREMVTISMTGETHPDMLPAKAMEVADRMVGEYKDARAAKVVEQKKISDNEVAQAEAELKKEEENKRWYAPWR